MRGLITGLILMAFSFAVDPQSEIEQWRSKMQNFTPQQAEQELRQKAGFKTQENDLGGLIDPQRRQDMINLFQKFQSKTVREFTCYQVRTIKVNAKWKCSYDGRLFEDEATCRLNCMRQYQCSQLPCYTVLYCERLSGGDVCPINKTLCSASSFLQVSDGQSKLSISGYTDGIEISGGKIRFCYDPDCGGWVSLSGAGSSAAGPYVLEVSSSRIRLCKSGSCGGWVKIGTGGTSNPGGSGTWDYRLELSQNGIRLCSNAGYGCGPWIGVASVYTYSCPLGDYPCVEEVPGTAYCSPFSCTGNINGRSYCMSGDITSPVNANVVGMWWCSGDGTWLTSESECIKNCPYYACEMDGQVYTGFDTCEVSCREVYSCEVF